MRSRRVLPGVVVGFLAMAVSAGFPYAPVNAEEHHAALSGGLLASQSRSRPVLATPQILPQMPRSVLADVSTVPLRCRMTFP